MSALLLGASVSALTETNQTRLIWFVVLFPFAVLAAFLWLVANHHRKLYSPADYRSDEGFLAEPATPQHLGERLVDEVDAIAQEALPVQDDVIGEEQQEHIAVPPEPLTGSPSVERRRAAVATAYLAESLAFKELQEEFGGSVRQHVKVRTASGRYMEIDGLIDSPSGSYIVEVKLLRSTTEYIRRVREALRQIERIYLDHDAIMPGTKGLLVVVTTGKDTLPHVTDHIAKLSDGRPVSISVRVFQLERLLEKYGFGDLKSLD